MTEKKQPWAERNKAYRREYQRTWRAKYKALHGVSYETDRQHKKKAEQEQTEQRQE